MPGRNETPGSTFRDHDIERVLASLRALGPGSGAAQASRCVEALTRERGLLVGALERAIAAGREAVVAGEPRHFRCSQEIERAFAVLRQVRGF